MIVTAKGPYYRMCAKQSCGDTINATVVLAKKWSIPTNIFGDGIVVNQINSAGTEAHTIIVRIISQTAVIFSTIV